MRFRFVEGLILLVFMFLCVPSPAGAQTVTGTIQGTVADSTGSVLPGVSIQIKNQDTGAARELTTNELGFYSAHVSARRPVLGHREAGRIRHGRPRGRRRRPESDPRRGLSTEASHPRRDRHRRRRVAADQYRERRGEGRAQRAADRGQADAQSRQFPVAGRDLRRLPGKPDQRPEQPDGLVRLVHQFQRHRHARRDVSDQRREQRRLVREPAPAGRLALDDQGVPDSDQYLQRRIWPRVRRRRPGADEVGHEPVAGRRVRVHAGQQRPDGPGQLRARQAGQSAAPVRRHRRFPDHPEPPLRFASFDRTRFAGHAELRARHPAPEREDAAADARQRHARKPRVDQLDHREIPGGRRAERSAKHADVRDDRRDSTGPRRTTRAASTGSAARTASRAATSTRIRYSTPTT